MKMISLLFLTVLISAPCAAQTAPASTYTVVTSTP